MKKPLIIFLSILSILFFSACNNNYPTTIPVTGIAFEPELSTNPISLAKDETYQLNAKAKPDNATNKRLAYTSDNPTIASIDDKGLITAKAVGNALITIKAADGISKTVNLTVTPEPVPVTSIVIEGTTPASLFIGQSYRIMAKAQPDEATNKELSYTADNNKAHVTSDGTVTAQSEGSVNITVKSQSNPEITATVTITIKQRPSIELITEEITSESSESNLNLEIKTLHGKLSYTPKIVGEGSGWLSIISTDNTTDMEKDTIYLKAIQNKTVWKRTAYINFEDGSNQVIKNAKGEKLEVKVVQKENENPNVTIKWVHGIDAPTADEKTKIEVPHVGQAKKFYWNDENIFFWYENANTKWFNNRKAKPVGAVATDGGDSNQCWGKTASNMLHWWFEQNENNINQYIAKKNITSPKKDEYQHFYYRNFSGNQEPEKSYIAKTFRTKAHNGELGGYVISGLAWYLYGNTSASHPSTPTYEGPALFKDVFSKEDTPIEDKIVMNKVEFETVITEALNSKKAIGLHMRGTKGGKDYGHAITLWGAVFDEEENIIAIYVVDNNYKENRIFPYGIYYRDGRPYIFNYPNNAFATDRYVGEVITLDKAEAQWLDWLSKH
ncbi:IdeS/Mac family cysteine endopeptidase [Treponema sp. OMZ 838]|uniref:IdeS/Mac family cysteine endopeptidase n=1 Tax=Treponema sp. OMZ 838 TaxID=1539298 RepID=UPI00068F8DF9|nr:IdeS/Mac family cysteine endopeptidase [Treponema sp. OMZ 838]